MGEADSDTPSRRGDSTTVRLIRGIDRGFEYAESFIVAGSIIVMGLIMVTHVLGRTFFRVGIPGITELTELLIILITFVGISYAVRRARHISMSAIYDQLSGMARKAMLILICLVTGALLLYLAWESMGYVQTIHQRGRATSALSIPLWTFYIVLPIGFFLAGIQYWLTALRNLTTKEMYRSFTEKEAYDDVPDEIATAVPEAGKGEISDAGDPPPPPEESGPDPRNDSDTGR